VLNMPSSRDAVQCFMIRSEASQRFYIPFATARVFPAKLFPPVVVTFNCRYMLNRGRSGVRGEPKIGREQPRYLSAIAARFRF
jgi:hypothetical protein